jgi:hypothetical protein
MVKKVIVGTKMSLLRGAGVRPARLAALALDRTRIPPEIRGYTETVHMPEYRGGIRKAHARCSRSSKARVSESGFKCPVARASSTGRRNTI